MKKIFCFVLIFSFHSCSRIDLAANWADNYITHQLDHYFDLDSLQSKFVRKALKEDVDKIKKNIFPRVAQEMQKVEEEVLSLSSWSAERVTFHEVNFKKIFYDGLMFFEPTAVELSQKLRNEQLQSFKKEFDSKTKDLEKEAGDIISSREKRFEKSRKMIESWIGNLTPEQRKELQNFCQLNPLPLKEQVDNREKLSRQFIESFSDLSKRKKFVSDLFVNYERMRDTNYAKAIEEDQQIYFGVIASILNKMTSEQRKHLSEILKDRIEQLQDSASGKKRGLF
ncbi:MAG: DUF6279 family lipoprotein [Bacteriovorax sp.]